MTKAILVGQDLSKFCPTTNHYYCEDGTFLLVTIPRFDIEASIEAKTGFRLPISKVHLPTHAEVFLSDAAANAVDADNNPLNDLTPLVRVEDCDSFAEALAAAGYELEP